MGLHSDTLAATAAADELAAGARQQIVALEDLEQVVATGGAQLSELVAIGARSLVDLQTVLAQMDTALNTAFSGWNQNVEDLEARLRTRRHSVGAEFATNDKAMDALLPEVQEALRVVESAVREAEGKLQALRAEDERLVTLAEQQATDAESQAQAMLGIVQAQRQDLERQSKGLDDSWRVLEKQLDTDLDALQSAFTQANGAAQAALDGVLQALAQGSTETCKGVRATLVDVTADEMGKLSTALGQSVLELQSLGQLPRRLAEQDMVALSKKLHNITEPLGRMDQLHHKAKSLELFEH